MSEITTIWCPFCKTRATVKRFPNDKCPQCGKTVTAPLTSDPYRPPVKEIKIKRTEEDPW